MLELNGGAYVPAPSAHNIKPGKETFRRVNGIMPSSSAIRTINHLLLQDDTAALLRDFAALPHLFQSFQQQDPHGTYVFETGQTPWADNSLTRYFVCFGAIKDMQHVGNGGQLFVFDACHLKNEFHGRVWLATERDSQHGLTIVAFGGSARECAEDARWMLQYLRDCFPTMAIILHDQGTALLSETTTSALSGVTQAMEQEASRSAGAVPVGQVLVGLCVRHLAPHLATRAFGAGKKALKVAWQLARARTLTAVQEALQTAQAISENLFLELHANKEKISLFYRLEAGHASHGQVTNSNAESANNMIERYRAFGPARIVTGILDVMQSKFVERAQRAARFLAEDRIVVPRVEEHLQQNAKMAVQWALIGTPVVTGTEFQVHLQRTRTVQQKQVSESRFVRCIVRGGRRVIVCPCRSWEDHGFLCSCGLAAVSYACAHLRSKKKNIWDAKSREFIAYEHSVEHYQNRYPHNAAFPVVPDGLLDGAATEWLANEMRESLVHSGQSTLPLYPWLAKPRAERRNTKKQARKHARQRSFFEILCGPKKRQRMNQGNSSGEDEEDNKQRPKQHDGEDASDHSNSSNDDIDHVLDVMAEQEDRNDEEHIEQDEEDEDNYEGEEFNIRDSGEWHDSIEQEEQEEDEDMDNIVGEQDLPRKKQCLRQTCARCGKEGHIKPACPSTDLTRILQKFNVLPGQLESTHIGKQILEARQLEREDNDEDDEDIEIVEEAAVGAAAPPQPLREHYAPPNALTLIQEYLLQRNQRGELSATNAPPASLQTPSHNRPEISLMSVSASALHRCWQNGQRIARRCLLRRWWKNTKQQMSNRHQGPTLHSHWNEWLIMTLYNNDGLPTVTPTTHLPQRRDCYK